MRQPDLNLLAHFDALMATRSVSRAADRMGISQPAMSAALSRLRRLFGDPLLVREGTTWQPTPQAIELHGAFQPLLDRWRRVTQPREAFEPQRSARTLSLYATDYLQLALMPRLARGLERDAPNLHLRVLPAKLLHGLDMLETNHVDLVAGYFPDPRSTLRTRFLFEERSVCLVREGHPCLRRRWDVDTWLAYRHVDLAAHTRYFGERVDRALRDIGRSRRIAVTLSSYLAAPYAVGQSDLIATLPHSVAQQLARPTRSVLLEVPMTLPAVSISLYWHERHQDDEAHAWLRHYIAATFSGAAPRRAAARQRP